MLKTFSLEAETTLADLFVSSAQAGDGLIRKSSANSFDVTVAKLEAALAAHNIGVIDKIDHAARAAHTNRPLRPTTVVLFGNLAASAQLMSEKPSIALDLPLGALVFEDENGPIFIEYNDVEYLAERHGFPEDHALIARLADNLELVTDAAALAEPMEAS